MDEEKGEEPLEAETPTVVVRERRRPEETPLLGFFDFVDNGWYPLQRRYPSKGWY